MGGPKKRRRLIRRARDLYARGHSQAEVARVLGVAPRTVQKWASYDRHRGVLWAQERERLCDPNPEQVLHMLQARYAYLVMEGGITGPEDAESAREHEKRLQVMVKVVKDTWKSSAELTLILTALQEFAEFCGETLGPDDFEPVRRAVVSYTDHLRRENQ